MSMEVEIVPVDYNPLPHKIGGEILKLFNNGKNSANTNNEISLLDCIQEFVFKSQYTEEEVAGVLEEDEIFKDILHRDCIEQKYSKSIIEEANITDLNLWSV